MDASNAIFLKLIRSPFPSFYAKNTELYREITSIFLVSNFLFFYSNGKSQIGFSLLLIIFLTLCTLPSLKSRTNYNSSSTFGFCRVNSKNSFSIMLPKERSSLASRQHNNAFSAKSYLSYIES